MSKKFARDVHFKEGVVPSERQMEKFINLLTGTKYVAEYHCTKVEEYMRQGKSVAAACVEFRITPGCFYSWLKTHPEFAAAYQYGLACAEKFWEDKAMEVVTGENEVKAAPGMIKFMLERKFKKTYGNSIDVTNNDKDDKYEKLSDEELDQKIKMINKEIAIRDFTKKHTIDVVPERIDDR
jgi:hypothetical protein